MYLARNDFWYIERVIYLVAGVFTLVGIILGTQVSAYWFALNILVGMNLVVFSLTGFCIMSNILFKLGLRPQCDRK
ncbi:MAG: DUF2892 domain-containing protein [Leptospiraceae bacterium]|nr:DUF2892 domain-containing protein [Leptospiraceae bacterium]